MSPQVQLTAQAVRKTSATQNHVLGTVGQTPDGRVFRYAKAGAADIVAGNLLVAANAEANHLNRPVYAAVAAGQRELQATMGATAVTADQYKDGYLTVNDGTAEGILYLIEGNTAAGSSGVPTIFLAEPLIEALVATTSEVSLEYNTWANVVISVSDQLDMAVGVSNIDVAYATAPYFWCQTRGNCSVLADEAVNKGLQLTIGSSVGGAVEAADAANENIVGIAAEALVDT